MHNRGRQTGLAGTLLATAVMVAGTAGAAGDIGLVEAARSQDHSRVRSLVTERTDVNVRSDDGSTALLWAAHWNDLKQRNSCSARAQMRTRRMTFA